MLGQIYIKIVNVGLVPYFLRCSSFFFVFNVSFFFSFHSPTILNFTKISKTRAFLGTKINPARLKNDLIRD